VNPFALTEETYKQARLLIVGAGLILLLSWLAPAHADSLVYTRQPRVAEEFANFQHWYDGGQPDRFTESDLVLDDLQGNISTIHDCTGKPAICAAHDGRVSPDGLRIAYTLAEGDALYPVKTWGDNRLSPPIEFKGLRYSIWIYDTRTKTSVKVESNARMPDWCGDDGLVFASDRAGTYAPLAVTSLVPGLDGKMLQIYQAKLSGNALTDIVNLTPESAGAMNPVVLSNGNICWSDYNGWGMRSVGHTAANMWWLKCMNGDSTNSRTVAGAHGGPTFKTRDYLPHDARIVGEGSDQLKLLRPLSEIKRGKYAVTSYYRSNHIGGMGIIYGFSMNAAEGCSQSAHIPESVFKSTANGTGRYVPCDLIALTPYAQPQDTTAVGTRFDDTLFQSTMTYRAMGKAGGAAASVDGEYIFHHCRGSCYEGTMPEYNTRAAMGGQPTAKLEIRKALVRQITDPFDPKQSVVIACAEEKWNCRDARYVVPYMRLFGIAAPGVLK